MKNTLLIFSLLFYNFAFSQSKGINFQAVVKSPNGQYPTYNGTSVKVQIMDQFNDCILREEVHTGINVSNGFINLVIGSSSASTPAGKNPATILSIAEVFDNSTVRTGLKCVDQQDNIASTGQTYSPSTNHSRKLRIRFFINSDEVVADFNLRSVPFAVNSETLGGKLPTQFVQTSTNITQNKVETLFTDPLYSSLQNLSSTNTGAFKLPTGTSAEQPSTPVVGMIRYNSTNSSVEVYNGSAWGSVGGTPAGSTYLASDGTAAAPGISFNSAGNNNTGLFLPANDNISISTNGSERVRFTDTGKVGIGTSTPNAVLDIMSPNSVTAGAEYLGLRLHHGGSSNGTGTGIGFTVGGTGGVEPRVGGKILFIRNGTNSDGDLTFWTRNDGSTGDSTSEKMRIMGNGNVGIGTTTPDTKLTIKSTENSNVLNIKNSSNNDILTFTNSWGKGELVISDGSTNAFVSINPYPSAGSFIFSHSGSVNKTDGAGDVRGAGLGIAIPYVVGQENGVFFTNYVNAGGVPGAGVTSYTATGGSYGRQGLNFKTSNGTLTTRMTIDNTGNVGIGTTNPTNRLTVPWISGDTASTAYFGSSNSANNQNAVSAYSYSGYAVYANSSSNYAGYFYGGAYGRNDGTGYGIVGANFGTGTGVHGLSSGGSSGTFQSNSAANLSPTLVTRQIAGGSADLFQAQNSTGNALVSISSTGVLQVTKSIVGNANSNSTSTIDFSSGNLQYTSVDCGNINLHNMKSGGTYTLAVQGTGGGTCNFSAFSDAGSTALTLKVGNISMTQTASKDAVFTFIVLGTKVYVASIDNY